MDGWIDEWIDGWVGRGMGGSRNREIDGWINMWIGEFWTVESTVISFINYSTICTTRSL